MSAKQLKNLLAGVSTQFGDNTFVMGNAAIVLGRSSYQMFILDRLILAASYSFTDNYGQIIEKFKKVGVHSSILHKFSPFLADPIYAIIQDYLYISDKSLSITIKDSTLYICKIGSDKNEKPYSRTIPIDLADPNAIQDAISHIK